MSVRRVTLIKPTKSITFVPVHYIPENKLSKIHKMVAAFDAFVVSQATGKKTGDAIIVHGDKGGDVQGENPCVI